MQLNAIQLSVLKDYDEGLHMKAVVNGKLPEGYDFGGDPLIQSLLEDMQEASTNDTDMEAAIRMVETLTDLITNKS